MSMTFFQTDTILDKLWMDFQNYSPAYIEAIPPIKSSHVNTPPQENLSLETNGFINQNEMSNKDETPEIETGRHRKRKIGQKRTKKLSKKSNCTVDREIHIFLLENVTTDSDNDSSVNSDEDNNSDESMNSTMNLVGAKKSTNEIIQSHKLVNTYKSNETSTKSEREFQQTESGSYSGKSSFVPQTAFKLDGLVVAKSQTSATDLHNEANDAVPSGSKVLCDPIHHTTDSDRRRFNNLNQNLSSMRKRKLDNLVDIQNNKIQKVTTESTKEKPKCLFRLLEMDKSLGRNEGGMGEDSDSSTDESKEKSSDKDNEISIEEKKEIIIQKSKQSESLHCLTYIEPNVIICQNPVRTSQVCPNPLTDRETGSGDTSNLFSQKQPTNTEIVVEEGFGTTLPNTVLSNNSDEKVLCIVAESEIHQVPKSESSRRDCMFQDLTFQMIDYSMDTLHKVNQTQTDIKNKEVAMDCDTIKDITNNHTLKQEFCSNSRETPLNLDQQSSIESKSSTKFSSANEIYGFLNEDVIKHRLQFDNIEDPQMCTQGRILTKTSNNGTDSSFRLSREFFEKESILRNAQGINLCNKCGQAKRLIGENVENNISNEPMLREEFASPSVIQREPMTFKNWSPSSSYVNQENNDNVRVNCKQVKTSGMVNSSKHFEAHQSSRAFPHKIDVNKIELQVQAQHNIFTGDDDCESEGSNLVIDEDHDSIKELNEPNEDICFVLKNIDGTIEKRCSISELRGYNVRRPKSTHVLPIENMSHAQVIPENIGVNKSNRSNLKLGLSDSIFLNSPAGNVISSCNNDERFYHHENRTFIPRSIYIQNKVNPKESLVNDQCFSSQNADDSMMIQGNVSNCLPVKPIENRSGLPQDERLLAQVKSPNVQIHRTEQPSSSSFNSIEDSLHSPRKSPAHLPEGFNNLKIYQNGELDSYYCSGRNKLSLANTTDLNELNQPSVSPNATFKGSNNHIQQCERQNLLVPDYHNSSVEYNPHEEHVVVYMQSNHTDYLNSSKMQHFSHSQGPTEVNEQMMQKMNMSNTSYSTLDPLCLVANNKDHTREIGIDFEYFGVCEEVEVTSVTEVGQNEVCRPNEIEDPDVSIAAEHSVTDSSVPVQALGFLYSPNKTNNPVCIDECNDQSCSVNSIELQQVSTDCSFPNDLVFNKDRFDLHVKTVRVDYNLCSSQREFKEFYLSQEVPQAIPAPYPLENRADKSPVRCVCEQCSDNHNILLSNYNILTNFRNAKVKPFNVCSNETQTYDKVQTCETDCNLPLKKRKTLTSPNNSEETKLTSYPNTPMISIAQLELAGDKPQNQNIVSKTHGKLKSLPSCSVVLQDPINYAQYPSPPQQQDDEPILCTRRRSTRRRKSTR